MEAVGDHAPLGPGVGTDVRTREGEKGSMKLEKTGHDGEKVSVPMDEIALAVGAEAQKKEREAGE